jgi:hypothetical protein
VSRPSVMAGLDPAIHVWGRPEDAVLQITFAELLRSCSRNTKTLKSAAKSFPEF